MTASFRRRIAFLDVDGTILAHPAAIAPSTAAAIRAARAAGHLVLLSTGRSAASVPAEVAEIGFDGVISNAGAFGVVGDELVVARVMPVASVDLLTEWFEADGMAYFLQTNDQVFGNDLARGLWREWAPAEPPVPDVATADRAQIAKAVFHSEHVDGLARLQDELGDRFHIVPGSMPLPMGSNGEVGMPGVTKGSAILDVLAHLGMDAEDAIGIGDSWNDAEMFQVCGTSIAMAEADDELKQIAGEVTTGVLDDGIWNAFARHGLI